jgi:hypothetical protein
LQKLTAKGAEESFLSLLKDDRPKICQRGAEPVSCRKEKGEAEMIPVNLMQVMLP